MPPLRLQNARPPEGGHDSRDNSLLTDSCDRLVLSANRIYQRPIHNSQPLLCARGTSGHRPLDLFIRLSLPTILSGPYSKDVVLLACKSYFSLTRRTSRVLIVSFHTTFQHNFFLFYSTSLHLRGSHAPPHRALGIPRKDRARKLPYPHRIRQPLKLSQLCEGAYLQLLLVTRHRMHLS